MLTRNPVLSVAVGCVVFGLLTSCNKSVDTPPTGDTSATASTEDDYNPHDVPITDEQKAELQTQTEQFDDAVTTIKQLCDEIEQETSAGIPANPFKAHQALDKADLVLQWLPDVARDSGIAKDHWEMINTTANDLRTLLEQVHQNIDNKLDPDFAAVSDDLDRKLAALEAIAVPQAPEGQPEG